MVMRKCVAVRYCKVCDHALEAWGVDGDELATACTLQVMVVRFKWPSELVALLPSNWYDIDYIESYKKL